jgi:hypothetical protein
LFENHPAALKHEANKKDILKVALIFFASFFGSSQKMKSGLGEAPIYLGRYCFFTFSKPMVFRSLHQVKLG